MKTTTLFSTLVCCLLSVALFAQPAKTLHQVFTPTAGTVTLVLDVNQSSENVEIRKTQGTRLMVESTIELSMTNDALLNYLMESGRYNLVASENTAEENYTLSVKKNNNVIIIKGTECTETIKYIFYVPESIKNVVLKDTTGPTAKS